MCLGELDATTRLGQLIVAIVPHQRLDEAAALVAEGVLGGVALLGDPTDRSALAAGIAAVRAASPIGDPFVMVDEEGGRVQRLSGVLGALPSARRAAAELTPDEVRRAWAVHGAGMAALGVTVALAPVVDVGGGPAIGDRSFSDDPAVVAEYAAAVAEGLRSAGVAPTLKHFPGHGRASGDSHLVVASTPPLAELETSDLLPYDELVAPDVLVMMGHLVVPGLTAPDRPASLDPAAYRYLRDEIGFDGLVVTDALDMAGAAAGGSEPERAVVALAAGADVALVGLDVVEPTIGALLSAASEGTLPELRIQEAIDRIGAARGRCP